MCHCQPTPSTNHGQYCGDRPWQQQCWPPVSPLDTLNKYDVAWFQLLSTITLLLPNVIVQLHNDSIRPYHLSWLICWTHPLDPYNRIFGRQWRRSWAFGDRPGGRHGLCLWSKMYQKKVHSRQIFRRRTALSCFKLCGWLKVQNCRTRAELS